MYKKEDYSETSREVVCVLCDKTFPTYLKSSRPITNFCYKCREDLDLKTDADALELLGDLESTPVSQRSEKVKGKRGKVKELPPATPTIDSEKVNAVLRESINYGLTTPTSPASLTRPVNYVIAKNGLFEVRHTDILDIIVQPKEVVGLSESLTPGIRLNLPKMPHSILAQTVAFFRGACVELKGSTEAYVEVWYSYASNSFHVHVPEQRVGGASVNHTGSFDRENERDAEGRAIWVFVAGIHSHGSQMSGFWSSTDDADERRAPEGRIFGVIGRVNDPLPDWRWRVRTREGFIDIGPADVFEMPTTPIPFVVDWDIVMTVLSSKDGKDAKGNLRLYCPVDPFKEATFPREWLQQLNRHQGGGSYFGGGVRGPFGHSQAVAGGTSFPTYLYITNEEQTSIEEYTVEQPGNILKSTGKKRMLRTGVN